MSVSCAHCGRPAPDDDDPSARGAALAWSTSSTPRGTLLVCPECTRANVRAIEAKLGEEWW